MGDRTAAILFAAGQSHSDFAALHLGGDRYFALGFHHEISELDGFAGDEFCSDIARGGFALGFFQPGDAWDRDVVFRGCVVAEFSEHIRVAIADHRVLGRTGADEYPDEFGWVSRNVTAGDDGIWIAHVCLWFGDDSVRAGAFSFRCGTGNYRDGAGVAIRAGGGVVRVADPGDDFAVRGSVLSDRDVAGVDAVSGVCVATVLRV